MGAGYRISGPARLFVFVLFVRILQCLNYIASEAQLKARRSFDHFRHEIQPIAHGGRGPLELFAVYMLCNNVISQTQLGFLDLFDRMSKRFDTRGIHRLHLLDETEEVVQPRQRGFGLVLGQFEPREVCNAFYIGQGQRHSITSFFRLTR